MFQYISEWSVYEATVDPQFRTNNVSEGYNSMLNKTPDAYTMIDDRVSHLRQRGRGNKYSMFNEITRQLL